MTTQPLRPILLLTAVALAAPGALRAAAAPSLDVRRVVNASYGFRKEEEPQMSLDEYALYERIVGMLTLNRDFAMKLLEPMAAAKSDATPAFLFVLGNVYFTDGQTALAEDYYRRAIAQLPTFTRAWANLGNLLFTQGKYQEAAICFTKVTATGERDAQTLGLLAYCLERTGRRLGAEMNYVQALGIDPDHLDSLRGLLSLSLDAGQPARAEELLKQLIRLQPGDRQNWSVYGSLLVSQNRPVEAIGLLESAAALDLLDGAALVQLCDLYAAQGFEAEAGRAFERLRSREPALAASRQLVRVRTLLAAEEYPAAERELAGLASQVSADQRIEFLQAEAALRAGQARWPEARAVCERILQLEPFNAPALLGLGAALKALGETTAADLVFERASRVPESAYRAWIELADSALRHRFYVRALGFLEQAASIQRSPPLEASLARVRFIIANDENR